LGGHFLIVATANSTQTLQAFGAAKPGLPLTKDGWKQVLPEDRVPFERESKGEYEAFAAAGGNLSKKAGCSFCFWTDHLQLPRVV
jgi:hypothetical protein